MSCDEGHSFSTEAVTAFVCGPDTVWKWNGLDDLTIPSCLSTYMFRCLLAVFFSFFVVFVVVFNSNMLSDDVCYLCKAKWMRPNPGKKQ